MSSALAEKETGREKKDEKVPLEKKLDKRGLLNLGYGYGINGLDLGYIGSGHYGGAYHGASHSYAEPFYLGHKTDVQKTVTVLKGVPYPYEVTKHVPVEVTKHVHVPVKACFYNNYCDGRVKK